MNNSRYSIMASLLLGALVTAGCQTRIKSYIAGAMPIGGPLYPVACWSNATQVYVVVDGNRIPMRPLGDGIWEADVRLLDGSSVSFEGVVQTPIQKIHLVPGRVR